MNLRATLAQGCDKAQIARVVGYIGDSGERCAAFMDVFLRGDAPAQRRAAWVLGWLGEFQPTLLEPYQPQLLDLLSRPHARRSILRALQFVSIPEDLQGRAFEHCYELAVSLAEPTAVKVFALTVAAAIARREPDLLAELRLALANQLPAATPGF